MKNKAAVKPPPTPVPWHVDKIDGRIIIVGSDRGYIANMVDLHMDDENAAFIVRAVNAYGPMLGALKWILQYVPSDKHIQAACREAIAQAEGQKENI